MGWLRRGTFAEPKALRVALVAIDHGPCTYLRILWPERAVSELSGLETVVLSEPPPPDRDHEAIDVVVLQRPAWRGTADAIPELQERGIAVTVDVDDDFNALHPAHRMRQHLNEENNGEHLARACAVADLVTAPTPALLERYAPHGRGALIRNYLPRWALEFSDRRNGRTLGWSGVAADHPGDLESTGGAVATVLRDTGSRFHVVGPPEGVATRLGLDQPAWGTGMLSIGDYFSALGSIDVGIVPLAATDFNAAKSWLKGLEWAAAGVPFVASPTPEYELLAEQGLGTIARSAEEWTVKLKELLAHDARRRRLAEAGRALVSEQFLLETNAWRWVEAWAQAREHRRLR